MINKVLKSSHASIMMILILSVACSSRISKHQNSVNEFDIVGKWKVVKATLDEPQNYQPELLEKIEQAVQIMEKSVEWEFKSNGEYVVNMRGYDKGETGKYTFSDSSFSFVSEEGEQRTAQILSRDKDLMTYKIKISEYWVIFTIEREW